MQVEFEFVVWNEVNGINTPYHIKLTTDDLDRIAMEKAKTEVDYDTKCCQWVTGRKITKLIIK